MKQIVCPKCGNYKVQNGYLLMGIGLIAIGLITAFLLVGIPILIAGIIMVIYGLIKKEYSCRSCGYKWKKDQKSATNTSV